MQKRPPRAHGLMAVAALLAVHAFGTPAMAQVPPGQYLAAVRAPGGEMYYVDPQTQKTTKLTVSTTLASDWANCVVMTTPVTGFIGTFNNPAIYSITVTGTKVTEKKLTTAALTSTAEIVQLAVVGGTIYFAQGSGTSPILYSVPVAGGAPALLSDLSKVSGWRSGGIVNALAANIRQVYMGVWTRGEVYVYDIGKKTTSLLLTLPTSKLPSTLFPPTNMQLKAPTIASTTLACVSLYGDVVVIDTAKAKVISHFYHKAAAGGGSTLKDSLVENTDTGDWALGGRESSLDILVPVGTGQLGRRDITGVGSNAALTGNRVVGLWYNAAGASYKAFGAGCAGAGGFIPTSVSRGAPKGGLKGFGFGLDTARNGKATAILIIGLKNTSPFPVDWGKFGAPSCFQRTDLSVLVGTSSNGTGDGLGQATIRVPVPSTLKITAHTQWAVFDPTNALGIVLSDARTLKL